MQNKAFIRIVAAFLAVLMCGGVVFSAIQVFAADMNTLAVPMVGDQFQAKWVILAAVVAVIAMIAVAVIPKLTKKK